MNLVNKKKELELIVEGLNTSQAPQRKSRKSQNLPEDIAADAEEIGLLGKKCCIVLSPWVPISAFGQDRPTFGPDSTERYMNASNKKNGLVAELYNFVPENFHSYLQNSPKFADLVCAQYLHLIYFNIIFYLVQEWYERCSVYNCL